jgi:hypothetical protein
VDTRPFSHHRITQRENLLLLVLGQAKKAENLRDMGSAHTEFPGQRGTRRDLTTIQQPLPFPSQGNRVSPRLPRISFLNKACEGVVDGTQVQETIAGATSASGA